MRAKAFHVALETINDAVTKIKTSHQNPYIIIGGDINQKPFEEAFIDHKDIKEVVSPPTRKDKRLDLCVTNINGLSGPGRQ